MTRAFTPPDTLSKEEIRTIADVRRDIWTSAFTGLAVGSLSGLVLHSLAKISSKRGILPPSPHLNRNTALFAFLAGGAIGSFLNATTTGKNEVHLLHPIFQVGSKNHGESSQDADKAYRESLHRAQERSTDLRGLEERHHRHNTARGNATPSGIITNPAGFVDQQDERQLRHQNRVLRRKTLRDTLEHGHGLSDSHGGRWVQENGRT